MVVSQEKDVPPNLNKATARVEFQTPAPLHSTNHPTTSLSPWSDPSDLGRPPQAVAAQEKPPAASCQPLTSEGCEGNNQRAAISRASGRNEYESPRTFLDERIETKKQTRTKLPLGLGVDSNQHLAARDVRRRC